MFLNRNQGSKKDDPRVISKLQATSFKYNGSPREDREGGGIAILYRRDLKIQPVKVGTTRSYEYGIMEFNYTGENDYHNRDIQTPPK